MTPPQDLAQAQAFSPAHTLGTEDLVCPAEEIFDTAAVNASVLAAKMRGPVR